MARLAILARLAMLALLPMVAGFGRCTALAALPLVPGLAALPVVPPTYDSYSLPYLQRPIITDQLTRISSNSNISGNLAFSNGVTFFRFTPAGQYFFTFHFLLYLDTFSLYLGF